MEKFLFFRNIVGDAALIPARKIVHYKASYISTEISFFLEGPIVGEFDTVTISVNTDQVHKVFHSLAEVLNNPSLTFIVIADDVDKEYLHSDITGVDSISLS
tara:strand:+ start:53 stop:358 length:306 start_codon:yes stop_codon:yes gene_type:complete